MENSNKPVDVVILGGGVIGVTTGIILNLHGYKTRLITKHRVDKIDPNNLNERPPELASIHAAASIIPHTVEHPNEKEILEISQQVFHHLAFSATFGVRVQRHYELYEHANPTPPEYARAVKDFTPLNSDGTSWMTDHNIPRRKGAKGVWGWYFNAFFAEVPIYMAQLYQLYEASGGFILPDASAIQSIEDIQNIKADAIINCMGRWATEIFKDDHKNVKVHRGHMVKVHMHEVPYDQRGQYFSYNYYPPKDVYQKPNPEYKKGDHESLKTIPADVYFYPRSDGWLLGGSRQEGTPEIGGNWNGVETIGDNHIKDHWKYGVPKAVWELNRELIMDITGNRVDIDNPLFTSHSYLGYRFSRDPIRLEQGHEIGDKLLFHNYGHGGAGYTLSWGCAYEILKMVEKETGKAPEIRAMGAGTDPITSAIAILEDLARKLDLERRKDQLTGRIK